VAANPLPLGFGKLRRMFDEVVPQTEPAQGVNHLLLTTAPMAFDKEAAVLAIAD
jgi:hypothetical protein